MNNWVKEKCQYFLQNPDEAFYMITSICLNVVFMAFYPFMLLLSYLMANHIFSYEILTDSLTQKIVFYTALIIVLLVSFMYFSSFIFIWMKDKKDHILLQVFTWLLIIVFASFNLVLLFYLLKNIKDNPNWIIVAYSALLFFVISTMLLGKRKSYFLSLLFVWVTVFAITIFMNNETYRICKIGLEQYGIASANVSIIDSEKDKIKNGDLILLTNKYIYLRLKEKSVSGDSENYKYPVEIIPRTDNIIVHYNPKPQPVTSNNNEVKQKSSP